MAVATPVLEKRINTVTPEMNQAFSAVRVEEDAIHNANIKDNFARLMNPQNKVAEALGRIQPQIQQPVQSAAPVQAPSSASILFSAQPVAHAQPVVAPKPQIMAQPIEKNSPYLVKDARADAAIFRADSAINKARTIAPVIPSAQVVDYTEEENEDLRPTATTIQYQTAEKTLKELRVEKSSTTISKKEKIIIGTFIGIVIMLFALIIINAAVISSLNADLGNLNNALKAVKNTATQVQKQADEASDPSNVYEYAFQNGMVWDGGND